MFANNNGCTPIFRGRARVPEPEDRSIPCTQGPGGGRASETSRPTPGGASTGCTRARCGGASVAPRLQSHILRTAAGAAGQKRGSCEGAIRPHAGRAGFHDARADVSSECSGRYGTLACRRSGRHRGGPRPLGFRLGREGCCGFGRRHACASRRTCDDAANRTGYVGRPSSIHKHQPHASGTLPLPSQRAGR